MNRFSKIYSTLFEEILLLCSADQYCKTIYVSWQWPKDPPSDYLSCSCSGNFDNLLLGVLLCYISGWRTGSDLDADLRPFLVMVNIRTCVFKEGSTLIGWNVIWTEWQLLKSNLDYMLFSENAIWLKWCLDKLSWLKCYLEKIMFWQNVIWLKCYLDFWFKCY